MNPDHQVIIAGDMNMDVKKVEEMACKMNMHLSMPMNHGTVSRIGKNKTNYIDHIITDVRAQITTSHTNGPKLLTYHLLISTSIGISG